LVRAFGLHPKGRRFEPSIAHHFDFRAGAPLIVLFRLTYNLA
jgi:hypothetical protein